MPSTIGHVLSGAAVAWTADVATRRPSPSRLVATCAVLAALPDVDILLPGVHRTATHSVTAALIVTIIAAAVTGQVTRWRTAILCGAAYASHLVLDWLGGDSSPPYGLQLFWPFSERWYISGWDAFRQTTRQHFFTAPIVRRNLLAVGQEVAILLPIVLVLWLVRVKTLPGLSTEMSRRHHAAE